MYRIPLVVVLAVAVTTGCATKKHVRTQVDPINQRVGQLESKNKQTDTALSDLDKGVSRADERAKAAQDKANEAAQAAQKADERAAKSGEAADAAASAAAGAKGIADKGLAKATDVEGRLMGIDNYELVATEAVQFAWGKSVLTPEAKEKLDQAAGQITKHKRYVIEIQGFTDKTGSTDVNLELSRRRANEVVRYLTMNHKVPLHRIHVLGMGSLQPVADDKTSEGRKQNRRVELRIYSADTALKMSASSAGGR